MRKQIDHLDDHCRSFLAHTPFVIIATAAADGRCDASPKGGPAGFVRVLDDHRLAIPDLAGNNRLDTMENLLANPGVALLCCIPGVDETLRINGRASLTRDPDVLAACEIEGRTPRLAIGVDVEEAYIHCAKALRRGAVWHQESWPDTTDMPTMACMLRDHVGLEATPEQVRAALEDSYQRTMWDMGGTDEGAAGATAATASTAGR